MCIWINSTLEAIKAMIVASRILRKAMIIAFSTKPVKPINGEMNFCYFEAHEDT